MDRFIYSLTGVTVPNLPIFQNVKEIVISLATEEVYSFNTAALQNALSKYIPEEGLQVLTKGLSIIHLSQNTNSDIKNQKNEVRMHHILNVYSRITITTGIRQINIICLVTESSYAI